MRATSPNTARAMDSGLTARSTFASVMDVTLKLPAAPGGRARNSACSIDAMSALPWTSWMPYQVPSVSSSGTWRVKAGVKTTLVGSRSVSSSSTWLLNEQTRVEYSSGRLSIEARKGWRKYSFGGGRESVDVEIALPTGSHVREEADGAGAVEVGTGAGDTSLERAFDGAEITTGSGAVHVGSIVGAGVIKNSNGDIWVGDVTGGLRVNAANGKISVGQAHARVAAKTANGDVYLGQVEGRHPRPDRLRQDRRRDPRRRRRLARAQHKLRQCT